MSSATEPVLDARNLRRSYGADVILDDATLSIHRGERVGLLGRNGCGKSTLARILASEESSDAGEISLRRDARIGYLPQQPSLDGKLNALENVLSGAGEWWRARQRHVQASAQLERASEAGDGLDAALQAQTQAGQDLERLGGWELSHQAESLLEKLQIHDPHAAVGPMSGGEQRRIALARLLLAAPDLAILDEPTNHLDVETIEWLERHLASGFPGAVLMITHDRYVLDRVVTRTLELERGQLYSYEGGYARFIEAKAERLALEERTEANRRNFLRTELEWLRRGPAARTTKQKARVQRAEQAIDSKAAPREREINLEHAALRSGKTILDIEHLRLEVPDTEKVSGTRTLVQDLTLHLTRGERLGIIGPNGAGKTTLLRALIGEHTPTRGKVTLGQNSAPMYLSQTRSGLDDKATVLENISGGASHLRIGEREVHIQSYMERFLFHRNQLRQPVGSLSGGERTRVSLAKLLLEPSNLLLLDEPTNDLDVSTLASLEELIREQQGTALVVSHDRWFLDRIATGILVFEGDGAVTRYQGDYSTVRALRQQRREDAQDRSSARTSSRPDAGQSQPTKATRERGRKPGLSYKEARELETIEQDIENTDARIAELDQELADPDIYRSRADEVAGMVDTRDKLQVRSAQLMERWAELEEKRDQGKA